MVSDLRSASPYPRLVISCHADTGFPSHRLRLTEAGNYFGHLDNFIGIYAVMLAYFSGRLDYEHVVIELTDGEEVDMAGARRVAATLSPQDVVVVVDVTATATERDLVIEKCAAPAMQRLVHEALAGLSYELHSGCPDPVSTSDEVDVYRERTESVFFLGIPVWGGDYNEVMVEARPASVTAAAEALVRLAAAAHPGAPDQAPAPSQPGSPAPGVRRRGGGRDRRPAGRGTAAS